MNPTRINFHHFSNAYWEQIESYTKDAIEANRSKFLECSDWCETLREKAHYRTGSISFSAMLRLASLMKFYEPGIVCEVGTFIGRSTVALSSGAKVVYTCDKDNDCHDDSAESIKWLPNVIFHPKKTSAEMFAYIHEAGTIKADFFFFDGRISDSELDDIFAISQPDTVYAMDDFVGLEKGVKNAIKLQSRLSQHILIEPRDGIALLIPMNIALTRQ